MKITHCSKELFYRDPYGAVPCGTPVTLRCRYEEMPTQPELYVRYEAELQKCSFWVPPIELRKDGDGLIAEFYLEEDLFQNAGLYFYAFSWDGQRDGTEYQITVYERDLSVPEWFLNTVIYQIFPDRFYKAEDRDAVNKKNSFLYANWEDLPIYLKNEDGTIKRWEFYGGNLKGITEKLDYIKSLGADTIYLNPIFEAQSNHRYDTADFMKVDGLLGGDAAFDLLLRESGRKKIRVILDGVFNHTGRNSKYFNPSDPQYQDWYTFREDGSCDCWWGVADLPAVNKDSQSYVDFIAGEKDSVVRFWSRKGIAGWRLDVADELPDSFIRKIRAAAEAEIPEPVMIGEVWEDASNKISYGERKTYFTARELHTHTNYVFRNTILSFLDGSLPASGAVRIFETIRENYPIHNFFAQVNMTGSHDVERLMTVMLRIVNGERRLARDLVKCFSLIQFSSPGVPLIYYGDETCLEGGKDPDNRRTYPWGKQDSEMIGWFADLSLLREENRELVKGDAAYYAAAEENVFVVLRIPSGVKEKYYMILCDRFGRGREFLQSIVGEITEGIEKLRKRRYIIKKEAGGYAMLVEFV